MVENVVFCGVLILVRSGHDMVLPLLKDWDHVHGDLRLWSHASFGHQICFLKWLRVRIDAELLYCFGVGMACALLVAPDHEIYCRGHVSARQRQIIVFDDLKFVISPW